MCPSGNRQGLWTTRHDAVEHTCVRLLRRVGVQAQVVSVGAGNWFGAAGLTPNGYRRADIVCPNYYGPGRHLFLDVAVADPCTRAALAATPSSASSSGVSAQQRAEKKDAKYRPLVGAISSSFCAVVLECGGAWCDSLVGLVSQLCGSGERDPLRHDDYTFSTSSRVTFFASQLTFAAVIAHAAMIERAIAIDVLHDPSRDARNAAAPRGRSEPADVPRRREVEGMGGVFWYERPRASS